MATSMKTFAVGRVVSTARPVPRAVVVAADRQMWLPSMETAPAHLSGTMAGDFGFDPLGLGAQGPERLKWYECGRLRFTI